MFEMIKLLMLCGTGIVIAFVVLLAMPKSELRSVLMPIVGWAMAIFCGFYAISPIDKALLGPFGLIDDIGAVIVGISSAKAAMKAKDG